MIKKPGPIYVYCLIFLGITSIASAFGNAMTTVTELEVLKREVRETFSQQKEKDLAKKIRTFCQKNKSMSSEGYMLAQEMLTKLRMQFPEITDQEYEKAKYSVGVALFRKKAPPDKVIDILLREANLLSAAAQILLRILYYYPTEGSIPFTPRILAFFKQSADEGIPRGQYEYGTILLNGIRVPKNTVLGIQLLEKSQMPEAYLELASYYHEAGNLERFKYFLRCAAKLDHPQALYNLGLRQREKGNYAESVGLFRKTLEVEPKYYSAQFDLALMYLEGWGVKKDTNYGLKLMQTVADQSEDIPLSTLAKQSIQIIQSIV